MGSVILRSGGAPPGRIGRMRAVLAVGCGILGLITPAAVQAEEPTTGRELPAAFSGRSYGGFGNRPQQGATGDFWYSNPSPRVGDVVTFGAEDPPHVVMTYYWTFGDGTSASGRQVDKTFTGSGSFVVTLQTVDYGMVTRVSTKTVSVAPVVPPVNQLDPTRLGFAPGLGDVRSIVPLSSTRALAASADLGLLVLDISQNNAWRIIGAQDEPSPAKGVVAYGHYAVMISDAHAGRVVDFSNEANPRVVAQLPFSALRAGVRGSLLYLASGSYGLRVIDMSNPLSPSLVASLSGLAQDIAFHPNAAVAYVPSSTSLRVLDVSQTLPRELTPINGSGYWFGCAVNASGTLLAAARTNAGAGLSFYSIANPSSPMWVSNAPSTLQAYKCAFAGNSVAAFTENAFTVVDVSNPATPVMGMTSAGIVDARPRGSDFYVANGISVRRFVGAGTAYTVASELRSDRSDRAGVATNGSTAVVASMTGAALVVDTSDAANPRVAGQVPASGMGVRVRGQNAYLASTTGLRVVDLRNPAVPVVTATLSTLSCRDVEVTSDGFAYTASFANGVGVVDLRGSTPAFVRFVDTPGSARSLALDEARGLLAVADGTGGVRMMSIANRSAPQEVGVGTVPALESAQRAVFGGSHLFVGTDTKVLVYGVASPNSPQEIQRENFSAAGLASDGSRFFLARSTLGVEVWEWSASAGRFVPATTMAAVSGKVDAVAVYGGMALNAEPGSPVVSYRLFAQP
ncbi:MAG: PKD domain-containing protein [Planctomycetia bacterium]|nr:MAG: PKD domain-containing protein [Planctomycetia bacterium]